MEWTRQDWFQAISILVGCGILGFLWRLAVKYSFDRSIAPVRQELHTQNVALQAALDRNMSDLRTEISRISQEVSSYGRTITRVEVILAELNKYSHERVHYIAEMTQRAVGASELASLDVKELKVALTYLDKHTEERLKSLEDKINNLGGGRVGGAGGF